MQPLVRSDGAGHPVDGVPEGPVGGVQAAGVVGPGPGSDVQEMSFQ